LITKHIFEPLKTKMSSKLSIVILFLFIAILFIQCRISGKVIKSKEYDIVGQYVNKTKAYHFAEVLNLSNDSCFILVTKYEWSKYEFKGVWKLKGDTLILECSSTLNISNKDYFSDRWLLRGNPIELILLGQGDYSLIRM
jgi:hypothetical protein